MLQHKSIFVCQQCGTEFPKWMGKCTACGEWNSLVESPHQAVQGFASRQTGPVIKPQRLSEIKASFQKRLTTGIKEFDRVLGGGIVFGSVILVAGEPGMGKSTLMLQLADKIAISDKRQAIGNVLYVSGEESVSQIKIRAQRLGVKSDQILFLAETNADLICTQINELGPKIVIIDSIQTLWTENLTGAAGSVGQIRESAERLLKLGKQKQIPIFLVGHVTKTGAIAGPKVLEHMVDTVCYFEGEKFSSARLLRTTKNRFGPTDEVGVFEMIDKGLNEVSNPSRLFIKDRQVKTPGSAVAVTLEGTRPLLVEIQALVAPTQIPVPRRVGQGIDFRRLQLITAVLAKWLNLPLATADVFVNITGGIKVEEPAIDLAVGLAMLSSFKNKALPTKTACFGELGLLGEIRVVAQAEKRIKEARRLGFTQIISSEKFRSLAQVARVIL